MKKLLSLFILLNIFFTQHLNAEISALSSDEENLRIKNEEVLLEKYSKFISKKIKPLVKNQNAVYFDKDDNAKEVEYLIKTSSRKAITKSYCSIFKKCIGYNKFYGVPENINQEYRLIDVKKDNAIFYENSYSETDSNISQALLMINLHSGEEKYFFNKLNFSFDENFILDIRSEEYCHECTEGGATGYNIDIYELDNKGEYILTSRQEERDSNDFGKSHFLARNPDCGPTPYFHSWKNNNEARISMSSPELANKGPRAILKYDKKNKSWSCKKTEEIFP
jgi:hypothetical protein